MEILGNKLKRFFDIVDNPPNDAEITYAEIDMRYGKYLETYLIRCVICQKMNLSN